MAAKVNLPRQAIVYHWKEEKVIRWLKKVQLDDCIPAFQDRHIDGQKLLELTEQKLFTYQDLKIKHRKQIAKCVQECKSQATNAKRIAKKLKKKGSNSSEEGNDGYEYDYDSDDWGSDFEDSEDEATHHGSFEVNNNILQSHQGSYKPNSSLESRAISEEVACIPKPPDFSVNSKAANGSPNLRNTIPTNGIGRPPLKRPPSQPPPPPIQVPSQDEPQEDYEIPIVSGSASLKSTSSSSLTSNENFTVETYELIDHPDDNYEIVQSPAPTRNMSEKPVLPPRHLRSAKNSSPPPLPHKPPKLKDTICSSSNECGGIKTFSRPRLPVRAEDPPDQNPSSNPVSIGILGSLMGRRPSYTSPVVSPGGQKGVFPDGVLGSLRTMSPEREDSKKPLPPLPLPPKGSPATSEDLGQNQNMATRPLPPVPSVSEENILSTNNLEVRECPWFQEVEREEAESLIRGMDESGSFVVRPSRRAGRENPYSLTVLHAGKLFHLNIRQRADATFALGKEKEKEKTFSSVSELIAYHQNDPILLKNRGEPAGKTILKKYPEKS